MGSKWQRLHTVGGGYTERAARVMNVRPRPLTQTLTDTWIIKVWRDMVQVQVTGTNIG